MKRQVGIHVWVIDDPDEALAASHEAARSFMAAYQGMTGEPLSLEYIRRWWPFDWPKSPFPTTTDQGDSASLALSAPSPATLDAPLQGGRTR
jgi:hypothetical protein